MSWNIFRFNSFEYIAVNWGSVISSLVLLSYIIFLKFSRPAYLDRVSLKIQVGIAVVDIIRHLNLLYGSNLGESVCTISAFLYFFCFHTNTFLNTAIALNLQIIYLHEWIPFQCFGLYLYLVPFILALVIDVIPFTIGAYGKTYQNFCFIKLKIPNREWIKMMLLYITNYPLLLYCFTIPIVLMFKLLITRYRTRDSQDPESQPLLTAIQNPLSRNLGFKVSFYPLACSLCHMGTVFSSIYILYTDKRSPILSSWSYFGESTNGTVNLLCFLIDPYIQESWNPPQFVIHDDPNFTNSGQGLEPNNQDTNPNCMQDDIDSQISYSVDIPVNHAVTSSGLYGSSTNDTTIEKYNSSSKKSAKRKKKVGFDLDSTRYYIAPIPIPGASSPDEHRREVWHTTDLHLDVRKQFRLN